MHIEKQAKDIPSRMFQQPEKRRIQQFRLKDNRNSIVGQKGCFQNSITQFNKDDVPSNTTQTNTSSQGGSSSSIVDGVSGGSSIVGGIIAGIAGARDLYNAYNDYTHTTLLLNTPTPLNMNNVTGSLESIGGSTYKAKIQGDLISPTNLPARKGPPGTKRRIVEGGLNSLSGSLNTGAGIASFVPGGKVWSAALYGLGTLSSGAAGLIRWWRSKG